MRRLLPLLAVLLATSAEAQVIPMRPIEIQDRDVAAAEMRPGVALAERRKSRSGTVLTRADIEAARPAVLLDVFRSLPGVRVVQGPWGSALVASRDRTCPLAVFVDGAQALGLEGVLDTLPPDAVDAVEIYRDAATTPVEYGQSTATRTCGSVFVWTRGSR